MAAAHTTTLPSSAGRRTIRDRRRKTMLIMSALVDLCYQSTLCCPFLFHKLPCSENGSVHRYIPTYLERAPRSTRVVLRTASPARNAPPNSEGTFRHSIAERRALLDGQRLQATKNKTTSSLLDILARHLLTHDFPASATFRAAHTPRHPLLTHPRQPHALPGDLRPPFLSIHLVAIAFLFHFFHLIHPVGYLYSICISASGHESGAKINLAFSKSECHRSQPHQGQNIRATPPAPYCIQSDLVSPLPRSS